MTDKIITYSFCDHFKDKLVEHIQKQYVDRGRRLDRLAIVFGGKRPALFMKRDLAKSIKSGFYPPQFFTIDEFMQYTVKKSESFMHTQDLNNCFLLYTLAQEITPHILKGRETFAQFLPAVPAVCGLEDAAIRAPTVQTISSHSASGDSLPYAHP